MTPCGRLLGVFLALAISSPTAFASGENGPSHPNHMAGSKLSTTCYFGNPSESCTFACNQQSMDAYCDDGIKQCVCKPSENRPENRPGKGSSEESIEDTGVTHEPAPATTTEHPKTNFKLSEFCVFGYPSPSCNLHCKSSGLKGFCDDDKKCVCKDPAQETGISMDWFGLWDLIQGGGGDTTESKKSPGFFSDFPMDWLNIFYNINGEEDDVPLDHKETQNPEKSQILDESHESQQSPESQEPSESQWSSESQESWEPCSSESYSWESQEPHDLGESEESHKAQEIHKEPADSDDEENANHLMFYVLDLDSLVKKDIESATTTATAPSATPEDFAPYDFNDMAKSIEGWTFPHVMAVIVIVFLCGLVLMELSSCTEKPKTPAQMESIFPTKK